MKFLVLLLATSTLASASLFGGKYIDVKDDGTVNIKDSFGKEIYITKRVQPYGKKFEIEVTGPNNFAKMYEFNYNNQKPHGNDFEYVHSSFNYDKQYKILDAIFREYLGHIDEYTYQQLLSKAQQAVAEGYFDEKVFHLLKTFAGKSGWKHLIFGEGSDVPVGEEPTKIVQKNEKLFKGPEVYGQDYHNQYDVNYYFNVLMKIFDKKVLKNVLVQGQIFGQEMYSNSEKLWDIIFSHEGIFDHQYLLELINNPTLRTWFIQHGYFDKVVLEKILYTYKTEGVYDHYLMQHLFNTQVLKYFFINHEVSVYDILGQTWYKQNYGNSYYNRGVYGYEVLEKMIYDPYWRNVMVQYGIFHKNVLDQILNRYQTEGEYDQVLLRQLINKEALYNVLVKYGVVDQTLLRQFIDNEYLALNYLYQNNFFQQTPRMTDKHLAGGYGYAPDNNNYVYGVNYAKNFLYDQQHYGYNQGPYSNGKFYSPYGISHQV